MSDSWFSNAVAPDGVKEDGCDPQEAEALKAFLRKQITTEQAAERITLPTETSDDPGEHLCNLWGLFHDALIELPESQDTIVTLLQAIQNRPAPDLAGKPRTYALGDESKKPWRDLPGFGPCWSDNLFWYYQSQWRDASSEYSRPEKLASVANIAAAEARLLVAGVVDTSVQGYERIADTLEEEITAGREVEISAVKEWMMIAGARLREGAEKGLQHPKLGSGKEYAAAVEAGTAHGALHGKRVLWQGEGGITKDRWHFWRQRLEELQRDESLTEGLRSKAKEAREAMTD
ncbi:hypothetical protein B0A50_00128 [Salinomyces thailandicus]|uniref:Uncharacterized protein n=1 Tax=Salinomyces thailandicus TaxID=706561 RepID=A0A4U0UF21_9PEZI|nr:hypothetical protein B0A50_00128 [Salinomyces thailandica]